MITEKIQAQRTKHPERDLDEFLVKIEDELIKKGIPIEVVGKILSEIK
jgi:signal recognition particle GTPase